MIRRTRETDPSTRRAALEEFCRAYWQPLYSYSRARGNSQHDAEDAVQGFLSHLLQRGEKLADLDASRGKLRSWLLTSFRNFLINEQDRENAVKRGGRTDIVSIDIDEAESRIGDSPAEPASESDLAQQFDRTWAETVLTRAQEFLKKTHTEAGKAERFSALVPFLTEGTEENAITSAAKQLDMKPGTVRMAVSRLRDDYRVAVLREIQETVGDEVDVEEEFDYLISCL